MTEFCDIHQHFVYGLDDGAKNVEEMQAMLRAAYNDGIRWLMATPHVVPGMEPFDEGLASERLGEAERFCNENRLDMRLKLAGEILYTPAIKNVIRDRRLPTLDGKGRVLTEFVPDISFDELQEALETFLEHGYKPILAHVERYRCLLVRHERIQKLREAYGARYQVNCGTLIRDKGFLVDRFVKRMLRERMIDYVATDAHDMALRPCCMTPAYERIIRLSDKDYAEAITYGNARRLFN